MMSFSYHEEAVEGSHVVGVSFEGLGEVGPRLPELLLRVLDLKNTKMRISKSNVSTAVDD